MNFLKPEGSGWRARIGLLSHEDCSRKTRIKARARSKPRALPYMEVRRSGSQPSHKGPTEYFTGAVRFDPFFEGPDPSSVRVDSVTFEPGARIAWHTHPRGQTLIVTAGCGYAQRWNGPIEKILPGDAERKCNRARFLRAMGLSLVASDLAMIGPAKANVNNGADKALAASSPIKFGSLKQIRAGALSVGYVEAGAADGPVVICLHGWPYDVNAYSEVTPLLTAAGYRVIVPYLRGFGPTRFLSPETFRDGEQLAFAVDVMALMDALGLNRAILAGYDYGGRAADIVAALWPERCKALVSGQGYLIINYKANESPLAPKDELALWFQYYFATERGRLGYAKNLHEFNKFMWHWLSPNWNFDDATFERTAPSFDNPDHVAIVVHNFRTRYELANGDSQYNELNAKLQEYPMISVPTITIATDFDGANASGASYREQFTGKYEHRIFAGYGHNVPQEDPKGFAQAVIDADRFS